MLPLYLSIEGLYSYQRKQEIDFTKLTEAGLFGIFGTVGSGKSSVLEAISYALYGETERLNSKEKRAYNMMNLKSNNVLIDFHFLNFEGRTFRFVAQWRRRKNFNDIADNMRDAYEWIDGKWVPLTSNDGAAVTNLSYANFRRTIIIPQGQFKEFLELKGKERSEMMKEIFFLNQYDLGPKVGSLLAEANKQIEHLKGALSGYEEVNEEIINQKNQHYKTLEANLMQHKKEVEHLEIQFNTLQTAKQNRLDLLAKQDELAELEGKKTSIEKIETEVREYELVSNNFKENLNILSQITSSKNALLAKIENLKESKDATKSSLIAVEQALEQIIPQYENLDNLKAEIQDLRRLIINVEASQAKQEKEARIKKGLDYLSEQKKLQQNLLTTIEQQEQEIENIKLSKINSADLMAIDSWYQKNEQLAKDVEEEQSRIISIQAQIAELQSKFTAFGYDESSWEQALTQDLQNITDQEIQLRQKEGDLRLKQELSHYIHNLHDGEPCPLCGSAQHPSPMQIHDLEDEFAALELEKITLKQQKEKLDKHKTDLTLYCRMILDKQADIVKYSEAVAAIQIHQEAHYATFVWEEFDKANRAIFDSKKKEVFAIEEQLAQKENELKVNRDQLQKTQDTIHKSESVLNELQNEIAGLAANITQNLQQLQVIDANDFVAQDRQTLELRIEETTTAVQTISRSYEDYSKKLLAYRTQYAQIKGAYTEAQEQHAQYTSKLQETQNLLHKLLLQFNYPDIATVKAVLEKNINISESRKIIQDFYIAYNSLQNRIQELQKLVDADKYSDERYEELSDLLLLKKEELELQIEIYGALKDDLERLTIELAKKQELLQEYQRLDSRKKNLDVIFNMFKGNGFVNYVSSIHLQRLCEIANQRFHRLTKNHLSLVINETNEFEVIDYLNDGRRRSAKTLSGGQAFQASLCLALALAENIQALNKADKNFFFIDEGFGTQDTESINTVFDTLQYLHQENRVVGIISHVEELKERMPRSITVIKDLEKGSQITIN